jgi:hypothetical protein
VPLGITVSEEILLGNPAMLMLPRGGAWHGKSALQNRVSNASDVLCARMPHHHGLVGRFAHPATYTCWVPLWRTGTFTKLRTTDVAGSSTVNTDAQQVREDLAVFLFV